MKNYLLILTASLAVFASGLRGDDPFANIMKSLCGGTDYDVVSDEAEKKFENDMVNGGFFDTKIDENGNNLFHRIVMAYCEEAKKTSPNNPILNNLKKYAQWTIWHGGKNLFGKRNLESKTSLTIALECSAEMTGILLDEAGKSGFDLAKLLLAALNGFGEENISDDVVEALIKRDGIKWETIDIFGYTFLHYAAEKPGLTEFLKAFIKNKKDSAKSLVNKHPNAFGDFGNAPLHRAFTPEQVTLLLQIEGIDVNIKNPDKHTPLQVFLESKKADLVKALLTSDKVDVKSNMTVGETKKKMMPLAYAEQQLKDSDKWEAIKKRMIELGAEGEKAPEPKPAPKPLSPADQALNDFTVQLMGILSVQK